MKKIWTSILIVALLSIMSLSVNAATTETITLPGFLFNVFPNGESGIVGKSINGLTLNFTLLDEFIIDSDGDTIGDMWLVDYKIEFSPVSGETPVDGKFTFNAIDTNTGDIVVYEHIMPYKVGQTTETVLFAYITDGFEILTIEFMPEVKPPLPPGPTSPSKPVEPKPEVKPPVTPPATNNQPSSSSSSSSNGNAWGTVAQSGGSTTTKTTETTTTTPPTSTTPTAPSAPTPTVTTKSFINGFENGTVRPNDLITRAQLAQIVYSLYYKSGDVSGVNYSEVSSSHWAYNAISFVSAQGYMTGYPDGTFKPDSPITRAEIATVISRLKNLQNSQQATFTDVSGHWATEHINKLVAAGFISGYPDNTFKPNDNATRAEAVSIISKAEGRSGKYTGSKSFSDLPATHWAYDVMMNATNGN